MKDGDAFEFVVLGVPRGFLARTWGRRKPKKDSEKKRVARYLTFRDNVVIASRQARCMTPLKASKDLICIVETKAFFNTGNFPDPENVHKGLVDALFYGTEGAGDRWCGGWFAPPLFDKKNPRVEVLVEWFSMKRYRKEVLDV